MCFAGRVKGRTFGAGTLRLVADQCVAAGRITTEVHLRLLKLVREYLPWQQFIKTDNKPGTLFFLDLPYDKARYYIPNFELSDYSSRSWKNDITHLIY